MKTLNINEINQDRITHLSQKFWSRDNIEKHEPFNPEIIELIYEKEIAGSNFSNKRIMILELSQYLENYLWKNYSAQSSIKHMLSIVVLINEKVRERIPAWRCIESKPESLHVFFKHLSLSVLDENDVFTMKEQTHMIRFLNHLYNSIESDTIRNVIYNTITFHTLSCISAHQLESLFQRYPTWRKCASKTVRQLSKLDGDKKEVFKFQIEFFYKLMLKFIGVVKRFDETSVNELDTKYCERFVEFLIDIESQLPTRRYVNSLISSINLIVICEVSAFAKSPKGKLFSQLLFILKVFTDYEIDDNTGQQLEDLEVMSIHYSEVKTLQLQVFNEFKDFRELSFSCVAALDKATKLRHYFNQLSAQDLNKLCNLLHLLPAYEEKLHNEKSYLIELLVSKYETRPSQLDAINKMPLYPTETIIWDDNIVPSQFYTGESCLALPKLNLQFLTLHDYLLRNFDLFRLESTYEIRQDIEDIVSRLRPWETEDGSVIFNGWARMAQPIVNFSVCEVAKPNVGEDVPSRVRADITVNLNLKYEIKNEWEALRKHDVCLLLTIRSPKEMPDEDGFFPEEYGIHCVRGCEIEGMLDANGRVLEEGPEPKPDLPGDSRTFRVWLDCSQYRLDVDTAQGKKEDIYQTFNVLMRRRSKENNFKAVLATIKDLMNTECVVPDWLVDIILGYGDPGAAHYTNRENRLSKLDFNDTFLDIEHLKRSFPKHDVLYDDRDIQPPFLLKFEDEHDDKKIDDESSTLKSITVTSYTIPNRGPFPYTVPKKNSVPFTATQVEAIRSGMQPGLTMVVGPPGTGKTDVAVQIISNIYHNNPHERTIIVTHSNQALNQLFEKIMCLDIDERHLLRLGHGEEALETEKDYSRYGRVNYVLNKRIELLEEVTRLKESLGVHGDMGASCETAGYFFLHHILSRWEKYLATVEVMLDAPVPVEDINNNFPFHVFFSNAPQPLFKGKSYEEDMEIACGCFRYLDNIFVQLKEFKAFEMLRSGLDRTRYLLVKEAKIIAMTCTHAALKRHELVKFGFQFDNILMEESAQILEIETFIPLLLQNPEDGRNRLKRWVMIGDHHQLPPVIKNMAFQKFSNMEQSLFTRFVRLGVPVIQLDAQGRSRPSICALYKWRYASLGDLPHVLNGSEYHAANGGFEFPFQLIDVPDLNGKGESEPRRYFYQNLAEAEYTVHTFMYMRMLGYPASKISMLTTYNGQRELLRDVVEQRCANNPIFGRPHKIATVDKYQGQQNDYILLSLVRTRVVGHLRDVRRLIVAMSRARLGLYIFGRTSLFSNCFELQDAFDKLMRLPSRLHLAPWERYGIDRNVKASLSQQPLVINDVMHISSLVGEIYQEVCEAAQAEVAERQIAAKAPGALEQREVQPNTGTRYDSDHEEEDTAFEPIVNEVA